LALPPAPPLPAAPHWRQRLSGLVRLLRPLNFVLFFAGVALGGILAGGLEVFRGESLGLMLAAMASAALIGASANAVNDLFDLEIDRINRPDRPLPSGTVSPRAAWAVWFVGSLLGIGLSMLISMAHVGLAVGSVALLFGYSAYLKRMPLVGNLAVALVLGLAILYGGLVAGPSVAALVGAAFAFLVTLAREIAKDIEDAPGDGAAGARTLPLVLGPQRAAWVMVAVVALTLVLLPLASFVVGLGTAFLVYVLPAAALLLASAWQLLSAPETALPGEAGRASARLKAAMLAGIMALAAARLL
jgi:geranylgeranylglycerol-phosphate geranylgeranyltransferase